MCSPEITKQVIGSGALEKLPLRITEPGAVTQHQGYNNPRDGRVPDLSQDAGPDCRPQSRQRVAGMFWQWAPRRRAHSLSPRFRAGTTRLRNRKHRDWPGPGVD